MKKILLIAMIMIIAFSVVACTGTNTGTPKITGVPSITTNPKNNVTSPSPSAAETSTPKATTTNQ